MSDEDCTIEGWTCMMAPQTTQPCSWDEETGEEDCGDEGDFAVAAGQCVPETWGWGMSSSSQGFSEAANTDSGTTSGGTEPRVPDDGTNGSGASGAEDDDGQEGSSSSGGGGGCQGGSAPASGLLALALLALAWVTRRKLALER